ncbi:MAG TPA: SURF1 family protein, partial [Ardenticatenaceae bacterium]|nr:SURF1 family protein [Ardenticatenaceae bacterium]
TPDSVRADLVGMEYRPATVSGHYDHSQEVALRNQRWEGQLGLHLLTPLVISGTQQAILVDRGWIPMEALEPEQWEAFAEPGTVEVRGMLRRSRQWPYFGGLIDPQPAAGETRRTWGLVDLERIDQQVSYELLPIYIQQAPEPGRTALPQRSLPEFEFGEGSHLGYAIQWFAFAVVIAIGYPAVVRHTERGGTEGTRGTGGTEGSVVRRA